jgi:hypothetical protein
MSEQELKARVSRAEKIAQRLWKALSLLEDDVDEDGKTKSGDDKKKRAAAREFRDLHVARDAGGILSLLTD